MHRSMKTLDKAACFVGVCALAAAAIAPASLSAQERSSPVPAYHLMQLTVQTDEVAPKDFAEKTSNIGSCEDARELAVELGADVKRNRFVRASSLPPMLQNSLKELRAGQATKVFSNDPKVMRVLVLCHRAD